MPGLHPQIMEVWDMQHDTSSFDRLVNDAVEAHFSGWDFSYLRGRYSSEAIPWDYLSLVRKAIAESESMLDIGTGGGEILA